jgi:hypothetical protein
MDQLTPEQIEQAVQPRWYYVIRGAGLTRFWNGESGGDEWVELEQARKFEGTEGIKKAQTVLLTNRGHWNAVHPELIAVVITLVPVPH